MQKLVLGMAVRIVVALALVGAATYFIIVQPHDQVLANMSRAAGTVTAHQRALEDGAEQLDNLPDVASIQVKNRSSVREYISKIDGVLPTVNVQQSSHIGTVSTIWREPQMDEYNQVVGAEDFTVKLDASYGALRSTHDFLTYHRSVMHALANLLEYDPVVDTSAPDEVVRLNMEAAGNGLAKVISRLQEAPEFTDAGRQGLIEKVKAVDAAREAYYQHLSGVVSLATTKDAYITAVHAAQREIIADRQKFWMDSKGLLIGGLQEAADKLRQSAAALVSLND